MGSNLNYVKGKRTHPDIITPTETGASSLSRINISKGDRHTIIDENIYIKPTLYLRFGERAADTAFRFVQ